MVLGCFDVSGGPFERVKYSPLDPVMRRIASRNYTSAMRIFVTDGIDSVVNFNGHPLRFSRSDLMSSCNKILSEDVIPSAPPLYPSLPGDTGNFRLKRIRDYEKEPESEIDRCKQAAKDLTLGKS